MFHSPARSLSFVACLLASTTLGASAFAQTPEATAQASAVTAPAKGQPADLCLELSAFVQKQASGKSAEQNTGANPGSGTAVQAPKPASEQPKAGGSDNPQQTSGLSAPITKEGTGATGPQGDAQETAKSSAQNPKPDGPGSSAAPAPQKSASPPADVPRAPAAQGAQMTSKPATPPASQPGAPSPTPDALQQAGAAVSSGDQKACRESIQKMRRAGVSLPAPLIALGALDPKFFRAKAEAPANGMGAGAPGAGP
jgi:hypothetical protein